MKRLNSERGSSTVLISLFLLTLVVFAAAGIFSSLSELKLARRNAETNKIYYSLDAEGQRFIYKVKSAVRESLDASAGDSDLFFQLLESSLDHDIIYRTNPDGLTITAERTIILRVNSYDRHLDIKVLVSEPGAGSTVNDICSVVEWKLWNEPFEYDNTLDLWEGNP